MIRPNLAILTCEALPDTNYTQTHGWFWATSAWGTAWQKYDSKYLKLGESLYITGSPKIPVTLHGTGACQVCLSQRIPSSENTLCDFVLVVVPACTHHWQWRTRYCALKSDNRGGMKRRDKEIRKQPSGDPSSGEIPALRALNNKEFSYTGLNNRTLHDNNTIYIYNIVH